MSSNRSVKKPADSTETRAKAATQCFCNGYNCSQAVLTAFAGRYDLDEGLAMRLSSCLGGGVGRMGEVCGTLTGAALVVGLELGPKSSEDVDAKEKTYVATRQLQERFIERHGSNICKELLQKDLSNRSEYLQAKELGLFKIHCPNYVETVVSLLDQLLEDSEDQDER
ncbi:MAG: C-GCAxxG-C-C family protein [Candidatus Thiodiazotropha sp. 6PLUC5]